MPVLSAPKMEEFLEARSFFAPERPITFDEFVAWFGPEEDVELVDGVAQKRMAAQWDHEWLLMFLLHVIGVYAEETRLGAIVGSRTVVRISQFRGRLPDLLFVRQENFGRITQDGLRFAPDLVIELVSPGDRHSDVLALEADYRNIGVAKIVFIDQRQSTVRVLRKQVVDADVDSLYEDETLRPGESLRLDALGGVLLPLDWLFTESRPTVLAALATWERPASEA